MAYNHHATCKWEIRVSKGSRIQLLFVDLDLERGSDCSYDYVEILDGERLNSPSLGKYCHTYTSIISSKSNSVIVKFRSDYSVGGRGFHLRYNTSESNRRFFPADKNLKM